MLSPDERPAAPAIPDFSRDMEKALVAAARASSPPRPARAAGRAKWAAAGIVAAAVAVAAGVGIDHAAGNGHPAASHPSTGRSVHIHVAAFWVDTGAGGTAALSQVVTSQLHLADGDSVITIVPSAIPAGSELSIGYFPVPGGGGIHVSLVPEGAPLTCTSVPPTPPRAAR
jgi:hypothetical protein